MLCANCETELLKNESDLGVFYECRNCNSFFVSYQDLVNGSIEGIFLRSSLKLAKTNDNHSGHNCSICHEDMYIHVDDVTKAELHVCPDCSYFWFRKEDFGHFPKKEASVKPLKVSTSTRVAPQPKIPNESVKELTKALNSVGDVAYGMEESKLAVRTYSVADALFSRTGLSFESDETIFQNPSIITWAILLFLLLFYFITKWDFESAIAYLAFYNKMPFRHLGLTIITSFLVNINLLSLSIYGYYFLIFGDNVEMTLGRKKFVLFLVLSHIFGVFIATLFHYGDKFILIGSHAGISSIIAFYCLTFPGNKLSFVIPGMRFYFYKINYSAWIFLVIWSLIHIIMDLFGADESLFIASESVYAGIIMGAVCSLIYKLKDWNNESIK